MEQLVFIALGAAALGVSLVTVTGRLGDLEVVGAVLGVILWFHWAQGSLAVEVYSGGALVATSSYRGFAVIGAILGIIHVLVAFETGWRQMTGTSLVTDRL
jgi:hypothetical protein